MPDAEKAPESADAGLVDAVLGSVVDTTAWVWENLLEGVVEFWGS